MNMDKILGWFTNKRLLLFSSVSSIILLGIILNWVNVSQYFCDRHNVLCYNFLAYLLLLLLPFVIFFIPTIISFFVKDNIFYFWKKTIPIYLLIYLLVVIITPWKDGDAYFRIAKDLFALYVSVGYLAFSLIFIAYKSSEK